MIISIASRDFHPIKLTRVSHSTLLCEQKDKVARIFFENQNKRALSRGYSSKGKAGLGKRGGRGRGRGAQRMT